MASSTTSPISKIDDDILLSVFDNLTSETPALDMRIERVDRPLTFIRAASGVCRRWRGLILSSPWIWGRLIDLDLQWGPQRMEWTAEIINRAGSAPLWIYGRIVKKGFLLSNCVAIFLRLLESSWERIEKLSVLVYVDQSEIREAIQDHFLLRAPILKVFEVRFIGGQDYMSLDTFRSGSAKSLFGDHAPLLRAVNAEQISYTSDVSWLSNLRIIDSFPNNHNLSDSFGILQHTPLIERIVFKAQRTENRLVWPNQTTFPTLSLPRLSSIQVKSADLEALAGILDHITPGALSSLRFDVSGCRAVYSDHPTIISSLKKNLRTYIPSFFTSTTSRIVVILLLGSFFKLCVAVKGREVGFPYSFHVSFSGQGLDDHDPQHWGDILACFLDAFTVSLAGKISALEYVTELKIPMIVIEPSMIPRFYAFFDLFRNIQVIQSNEHSGKALLSLSHLDQNTAHTNPPRILFPRLHTLRLSTNNRKDWPLCTDLTSFLIYRKCIGFPVTMLDLTDCRSSIWAHNLRDLEAVCGLEVVWAKQNTEAGEEDEICSYICGSGHPERLENLISNS